MNIIRRSRPFFGTNVMIGAGLIALFVLWNSFTPEKGGGLSFPEEAVGYLLPLVFMVIALIVFFSRDEFLLDFDRKYFSNHIRFLGIPFFREEIRLPGRIIRVLVIRSVKQWKRYIAVAIPFTTSLLVYEVYIADPSGRLIRLFSAGEEQADEYSTLLTDLYGVDREYREMKGIRLRGQVKGNRPGRGSQGLPPQSG
jgi:hypothetical protein